MDFQILDDQFLVQLYLEGNENAFEELLMRHKDKIFRSILHKVKEREIAQDIFQEAFVKIINTLKLGNYNEEGKFLPWAMRIAQNLVIDHFRRQTRVKIVGERNAKSEDFNVLTMLRNDELNAVQKISKGELENQLLELIKYLPSTQREIIEMRIFQDLSFKEIAEMENISINTALGRMRYALINMRKLIEKHRLVVNLD
jgi:RNA polymerase sigma-70 factor (ECF subfamily)